MYTQCKQKKIKYAHIPTFEHKIKETKETKKTKKQKKQENNVTSLPQF